MKQIFRVLYPILIYLGITSILVFSCIVGNTIIGTLFSSEMSSQEIYYDTMTMVRHRSQVLTAVAAIISVPILWLFYMEDCRKRGTIWKNIRKIPPVWLFVIVLGISSCIAGNNLVELIHIDEFFSGFDEIADLLYAGSLLTQILCVGIIIPAAEEMVFRVLGFRRLRDYSGFWSAALISSSAFAVFHGNVVQGTYAFLIGIVICYAYERQDNPAVPYLIHASANITSVLLTALPEQFRVISTVIMIVEIIISVAVAVFCMRRISQSLITPDNGLEEVNQ